MKIEVLLMGRVLVACEFSGIVRDAFIAEGHDAISCDLLPTERPGPHIQADVLSVIDDAWDMMLAFPPCTYLAVSGARWWAGRQREQIEAFVGSRSRCSVRLYRKSWLKTL